MAIVSAARVAMVWHPALLGSAERGRPDPSPRAAFFSSLSLFGHRSILKRRAVVGVGGVRIGALLQCGGYGGTITGQNRD